MRSVCAVCGSGAVTRSASASSKVVFSTRQGCFSAGVAGAGLGSVAVLSTGKAKPPVALLTRGTANWQLPSTPRLLMPLAMRNQPVSPQ